MSSTPVIEVRNLRKTYGTTVAVDGVSLTVDRGEILGVLGPNGAGKTTTVETIAGLRTADAGRVSVLGLDPLRDAPAVRERVGVQLQESELPARIRVDEAMSLYASFYADPADPGELLRDLGLADHHATRYGKLSGGQKQRLSVALALVGKPEIAILDELTTGLDPQARRETWALVERVRDRGVTILLVTHFMEEAERLCDRVVVIDRGRVIASGPPAQVAGRDGQVLRFRTEGVHAATGSAAADGGLGAAAEVRAALAGVDGVVSVETDTNGAGGLGALGLDGSFDHLVRTRGDAAVDVVLALAAAGIRPHDLRIAQGSLEDAFVQLVTQPQEV